MITQYHDIGKFSSPLKRGKEHGSAKHLLNYLIKEKPKSSDLGFLVS